MRFLRLALPDMREAEEKTFHRGLGFYFQLRFM